VYTDNSPISKILEQQHFDGLTPLCKMWESGCRKSGSITPGEKMSDEKKAEDVQGQVKRFTVDFSLKIIIMIYIFFLI
jgi:hypothetical protein